MPIPQPKKDEEKNEFIARCVSDPSMNKEFPNQKQRLAVCFTNWKSKKSSIKDTLDNISDKIIKLIEKLS